jgi:hypothetical protein
MITKIFPKTIDDTYKGYKLALYFFCAITAVTLIRSLIHIFAFDGGAESIATIPLNQYPKDAVSTIIFLFSLWGSSQLIIGLIYLIVLLRYKSLIPLMYVLLFAEYTMRLVLGHVKPIVILGTAPATFANYIMIPLSVILFILSIQSREKN